VGSLQGIYLDQSSAYEAAAAVIEDCDPQRPEDRVLSIASMHGHGGLRLDDVRPTPPDLPRAIKKFDQALSSRIKSDPEAPWYVRELCNVTTPKRFQLVLGRMGDRDRAPNYEVRAYCKPGALPMLAPLIVGGADVLLATEHETLYRAGTCIHFRGTRAVKWATGYFDRLWGRAEFELRTPMGVRGNEVERLQVAIDHTDEAHSDPR
jgi:hypothetical protein